MNQRLATVLFGLFLVAATVSAQQITVGVRTATDLFLLYESIDVEVGLRNNAGRAIEMESDGDQPWLHFLITDQRGRKVAQLAPPAGESVLIGARQTVSQTFDLLPLYDLREPGQYKIQALVAAGGTRVVSPPTKITLVAGRDLWTETVGLPAPPGAPPQYRTYSLINKQERQRDVLYAGVTDDEHDRVYGMLPLGRYVALGKPEAEVDNAGQLHALWRLSPRQFGYVIIDPFAAVVDRAIYTDLNSPPHLVRETDGRVRVQGGRKTHPKPERGLGAEALPPPPPPTPQSPPKKQWWQFWRKSPKPAE